MINSFNIICEILQRNGVQFVIHSHNPRSGSLHYDLRFINPKNPKELFSFAAPKNFLDTLNTKTVLAKTRDHDSRWLTLKSYRLEEIDKGVVVIKIATSKYFELDFYGKVLNGSYKLFKMRNTFREDRWLLTKNNK